MNNEFTDFQNGKKLWQMSASARNLLACHSHIKTSKVVSSQKSSTEHPVASPPPAGQQLADSQPAGSLQPGCQPADSSQQPASTSESPAAAASTSQPAVASIRSEPASQRSGSLFVHLSVSAFVCFWLAVGWLPLLAGCGWLVGGCLWLASWLVGRLATAFC